MKICSFLVLIIPVCLSAQINVVDDFSDGDFTQNPMWLGDTSKFLVNDSLELQLNDTTAGMAYLSTASAVADDATWQFSLVMDFNPSSSNYAKVYLMSDEANLNGGLNGYFVRIGGSSSDRVSLFQQTGNQEFLVLETDDDWVDTNPVNVRIEVNRRADGFWKLAVDTSGHFNFMPIDSALENTHKWSNYFGVAYQYTSTRSNLFFFDDLNVNGFAFIDNSAPILDSIEVLNSQKLLLSFNELVEISNAQDLNNYSVNGGVGSPVSAVLDLSNSRKVELDFGQTFQNKTFYELTCQNIADAFANDSTQSQSFMLLNAEEGDIIINELMPDPSPSVGNPPNNLPEREYIELYNRSNFDFNLKHWLLGIGSSQEVLPNYTLVADSFVVITKDEYANEFSPDIPLLALDMSSVALTNSGNTVSIYSPENTLINTLSYTDEWYKDPNKEEGGWSLELIDPDNLCGGEYNWQASIDLNGGTPGKQNSVFGVNPDTVSPFMLRITIVDDKTLLLYFSESLSGNSLRKDHFTIQPFLGVDSINISFSRDEVLLHLNQALQENLYKISLDTLPKDCSGNVLLNDTLEFGLPSIPEKGDILINEVLFNPFSGGSDFVELYNISDKIFDLSRLLMGNYNSYTQSIESTESLSEESRLFYPKTHLCLSTDTEFLRLNYSIEKPENLLQINSLPSMPDDEGSIALSTSNLVLLDYFEYSDAMHLQLIDDQNGISLERLSHGLETNNTRNWQSAASSVGYATPGYENSQYFSPHFYGELIPEPKVFSPNHDGYNDFMKITYKFEHNNNIVNLSIYDARGFLIKEIAQNENVGTEGFFIWDGIHQNGQLAKRGIYLIVLDFFNENGTRQILNETCVLSR